jgi:acetyl esterase/lipase
MARIAGVEEKSMPLDPVIQDLFQRMPELITYPTWEKSPSEARIAFKRMCRLANADTVPIGKTEDIKTEGGERSVPLRVYTPVAAGSAALPAIVYYHGGGFVIGDLDCYDPLCRMLANESGCRVISVDYRLAPEHPFPAAVEDAFAALKWVEANATDLAIDPNRLAVAGDSAGGNLAAVISLLAADAKEPEIAFQLLIYPSIKLSRDFAKRSFGTGYRLDDRAIQWFYSHYMPADADPMDVRLSPIAIRNASGLPPAYIVTAGFDPLRDEGIEYAEKLKTAGVPVALVDYPTMIHGFFSMQGWIPLSSEAITAAAKAVKAGLDEA